MKSFSIIDEKVIISTVHDLFEDFDLPPNIIPDDVVLWSNYLI